MFNFSRKKVNLIQAYLTSPRVQKILSEKSSQKGFSLVELVVVIAVLAILSAVAIPAFVGVQANARASAIKNGLVNTLKECVVREASMDTTTLSDAQSANGSYSGYKIIATVAADVSGAKGNGWSSADTCFAAKGQADAASTTDADFVISMKKATGEIYKWCEKEAPGCTSSKTWK